MNFLNFTKRIVIFLIFTLLLSNVSKAEWQIFNTMNSPLTENEINGLTLDNHNNIWVGTMSGDIFKVEYSNWFHIPHDSVKIVQLRAFMVGSQDDIWAGGSGGIMMIKNNNKIKKDGSNSLLRGPYLNFFEIDSLKIFVGSTKGLYKLNRNNLDIIYHYNDTNSVFSREVGCIAKDSIGNFWFGTPNGLIKYDGINWSIFDTANTSLKCDYITSLAIDKSGNKWIGTAYEGVYKYDDTNWTNYNLQNDTNSFTNHAIYFVIDIKVDTSNNIWFAGSGGVAKLSGSNWSIYSQNNSSLPGFGVRQICFDNNNNKWFATNNGLAVFNETGIVRTDVPYENNQKDLSFSISPNPATDFIEISITQPSESLKLSEGYNVSIYNVFGQEESTSVISDDTSASGGHFKIDISGLATGVYFVRVGEKVMKFVKI